MIKKFTCLGCASLGLLALSACGVTTPVTLDQSTIWVGGLNATNQVSTQGYWWTYTDHNAYDITHGALQYERGAWINPLTNLTTPLTLAADSERGKVVHVVGSVPPAPAWADVSAAKYTDLYWQSLYPDALVADYPSAGVGFGFQPNNAPFDVTQGKYVGVRFDMKTAGGTASLSVSLPTQITDVPDQPNNNDQFSRLCAYPHIEAGKDDATSFVDTDPAQSCFGDYHKVFGSAPAFAGDARAADGVWKTYCVLWSELGNPIWIKPASKLPAQITTGMLQQALKLKWDFDQPANGAAAEAFEISLDNIVMVTAAEASTNGVCNPNNVQASATIANVAAQ